MKNFSIQSLNFPINKHALQACYRGDLWKQSSAKTNL